MVHRYLVALAFALGFACASNEGDSCKPGTEGCPCLKDFECVGDLSCTSSFDSYDEFEMGLKTGEGFYCEAAGGSSSSDGDGASSSEGQ